MSATLRRALGLMSGTSLDGIDVAFIETDGRSRVAPGPALTVPYDEGLRSRLRSVLGGTGPVASVERELTDAHAAAVEAFLARHVLRPIDVVGFHGHTILHRPREGRTWQIGDGARLAARIGIDVVADFRSADVAAGGEGAPLVPVFHAGLAAALERPLAILNLGGVGNVTWLGAGEGEILAFDTGPGNAMIDDWVLHHTGRPFDAEGALARVGRVDQAWVEHFLAHPFFDRPPPKSLDRDDFRVFVPDGMSAGDGAATLTAMTVAAVAAARRHFPAPPRRWLVTGGGRHNPGIMAALAAALGLPVEPVEAVGWDGDALEAQAFGYLAVRSLDGLPLSFPTTTGVHAPTPGGRLFRVDAAR
ncbi:MAG TPA: anhydro-N-acetylmuramic acid kinase [Stellaceae bacterium]|nr:anhydro-N-acetylmuramic acid kinase [Stellaceae bacterium]